ncbi:hypothetical protein INS49_014851 [Diaporthe citri]|uniref:uncharacterized protein n=1 Tax=Diaporthe citri TaxID=83186 RepID=UPI001C7FB623|nr:uncharacterized protein INS49_014851 [Diaporthe citri]KAG6356975.1 hypothetical protein INS49_014851 [Diaporthe citri]
MIIFRVSVFLALATFSLNAWAKYLGKWGLENVAISCPNDGSCTYNFRITRGIGTPDQFYRHTDCNFTIKRSLDHPASQVNLTEQPCNGSFDQFKISGQWYYRGFITFRVTHEVSDGWAFFGYEASQVLNSNASRMSVSDCYQIDTFNATDRPPGYPGGNKAEPWVDTEE